MCQAVSSMPAVLFSDQLVEAYPNAKIILTESDPDTFVKSMQKSYYNIINDRSTGFIAMFDSVSNISTPALPAPY